ncbi:MAG: inorganic diphosphatase, partial [Gammaproteobacteria bacterium]
DGVWGDVTDISQLPESVVDQLVQYFETYKAKPVSLGKVYGHKYAEKVIAASMADYTAEFED